MKLDAIEALMNATVGLVVSWVLSWAWFGFTPLQAAHVTAVFFLASFARAWIIRAAFRRWG